MGPGSSPGKSGGWVGRPLQPHLPVQLSTDPRALDHDPGLPPPTNLSPPHAIRLNHNNDSPAASSATSAPIPAKMNAISVSFFSITRREESVS